MTHSIESAASATELVAGRWLRHATETPDREAIVHYATGEVVRRWTWGELLPAAANLSGVLNDAGVRRGDVCALIMRHHPDFYPLYMAVELIGAIPSVLAYPNERLHPDKFRAGLTGMARVSGLDWILTEPSLGPRLESVIGGGSTIRGVLFPLASEARLPAAPLEQEAIIADAPCLLQHSSGTTGLQKAVVLSHRAVLEHARRYGDAIELASSDRIVSWLPLYHDMGLIATFHMPLAAGVPVAFLDPFEWVAAPSLFLDACSRERATLAWLPNFAYHVMATRVHDEDLEGVRLDSVRLLVNCSEPVRADSHDLFAARFSAYGLSPDTLGASYAMAETTFAVTQTPPGAQARRVVASRDALSRGRFIAPAGGEAARVCVSSGRVIDGCELRVVNERNDEVDDGNVGELVVRSVSLFDGYRNNDAVTAAALRDGWFFTGDYGFRLDDEIFVVGRKKDIIIVAGKNLYPEDVEDAVSAVAGVSPGRVVAFARDDAATGTERVCVVAETALSAPPELTRLREAIGAAAMQIDVTISEVFLVEPRWLIKSSAGKPSRSANRERILAEVVSNLGRTT